MKFLFSIILNILSFFASSQSRNDINFVKVSFIFSTKIATDSSDLTFKVVFHNASKNSSLVYSELVHGSPNDDDCNFYIVVEKLNGHNYEYYPLGYYSKLDESRTDTTCHDLAKRKLPPLSSDTLTYNLMMIGKYFDPGKYRFKVYLRKRCKILMSKVEEKLWHAEINYVASKWLYFQAPKQIFSK